MSGSNASTPSVKPSPRSLDELLNGLIEAKRGIWRATVPEWKEEIKLHLQRYRHWLRDPLVLVIAGLVLVLGIVTVVVASKQRRLAPRARVDWSNSVIVVPLPDNRQVICVETARGVSCDWAGAK
jgi:hypothetical protein